MHKKRKTAFTLAEVLITLAIIGIIAAMVIPSLLNNINNMQYVTALKKIYSSLSQATQRIVNEEGGTMEGLCDSNSCMKDLFLEYMIGVKSCEITSTNGCWHKSKKWFSFSGSPVYSTEESMSVLVGNDGSLIEFMNVAKNCNSKIESLTVPVACARMRVDVNGYKSPNTVGKDIFDFYLLKNRVVPRGGENDAASCPDWGCAAKVLTEGAINY